MGLNTYPSNPFPPSTDRMDADALEADVNKLESDVDQLKSGLTNVADDVKLNTNDLTTPSRTKNILPMTVKGIKEQNTVGTWSGNNYVYNFITFTIQTDSDDNVIGIIINGTSTGDTYFYMPSTFLPGSYKVSAAQSGTTTRFTINVNGTIVANIDYDDNPFALTVNNNDTVEMYIKVLANTSNTNNSVKPIVVDFTETDITFAPYIPSVESRIEAVESDLIKVYEVPYSDFTWDADQKRFYCTPSGAPSQNRVVGSFVMPTNGAAIMGLYIHAQGVYYVTGFTPVDGQSISSGYIFKCFVYYI